MKNEYRLKINTTYGIFCPQFRKVKSLLGIKVRGEWLNILLSDGQSTSIGTLTHKEGSPHEYDEWYYSRDVADKMITSHKNALARDEYTYVPIS